MMEERSHRLGQVFLNIVIIFILGSLISSIFVRSSLIRSLILYLILFLYLLSLHRRNLKIYCVENHITALKVIDIVYILIFLLLLRVIGEYVNALSMVVFKIHYSQALELASDHMMLSIVALAILPAIVEEGMFRGYVFQRMGNGLKAILMSAMMFALWHMNFNQMCYAFVLGILFALIYRYTDNLLITMLIHMLFNLYTVILTIYYDTPWADWLGALKIAGYALFSPSFLDTGGHFRIMVFFAGTLIVFLGIVLFILVLWAIDHYDNRAQGRNQLEDLGKNKITFFLVCAICILMALLTETMG